MNNKLLFLILFFFAILIISGCDGLIPSSNQTAPVKPTAVETPQEKHVTFRQLTDEEKAIRYLTDDEKAEAIKIAKAALIAAGGSQPNDYNRATFVWIAQTSDGTRTILDYDIVEKGLPANAPLNAKYYPGLEYQLDSSKSKTVVVDLQNGKAAGIISINTAPRVPSYAPKGPLGGPDPALYPLSVNMKMPQQVYLPGETVDIPLVFTNDGTDPGVISPFPPALRLRNYSIPGGVKEKTTFTYSGNESFTLGPKEAKTFNYTWNQRKADGTEATPGWYEVGVLAYGWKAAYPGHKLTLVSRPLGTFLIQYPQGAMEKTITVNQTQTGVLHTPLKDDGSYDYVVDIAITLERIELHEQGVKFYVSVTTVNTPVSKPYFGTFPPLEYSVDGVVKDAGEPEVSPEGRAVTYHYTWESNSRRMLDPIPSDAKEIIFRISKYREWQGPWEFRVPLQ